VRPPAALYSPPLQLSFNAIPPRHFVRHMPHPAEELWARHHPPSGYPDGVLAVPRPIPGIAFFPGGYGLWRPDPDAPLPDFPVGGVMVLGHDFHSQAGYEASWARRCGSPMQPTWRQLTALLDAAGIERARCFFTNVYLGLRAGAATTGTFPGAQSPAFVEDCLRFLGIQLATQRPSLVLTLGINVPPLLGRLSPMLADWTQGRGLKHLDRVGPVRRAVRLGLEPAFAATVVALTHPSLRHASVRHRRYQGLAGHDAELAMLRDAHASAV